MADPYLTDDQQDKMKSELYGYLKDKAMRRSAVTGTPAYNKMQEQFERQEKIGQLVL